ncbi:MAG: helix-turn-helix transcriptional regulator, partial [Oscillospiraceae bacterium]
MTADFNRLITLLRKERGITQKMAAEELGVSQALLSHYEKGIRECGLDFVVRIANYYNVSCDYLLGRSPDRSGLVLTVDEIPNPESNKDSKYRGSTLPTLNKKLISNSLNILFDKLNACPDKELVTEISGYLMMSVYKMFRLVYAACPKNSDDMFSIGKGVYTGFSSGAMNVSEARVSAILAGGKPGVDEVQPIKDT